MTTITSSSTVLSDDVHFLPAVQTGEEILRQVKAGSWAGEPKYQSPPRLFWPGSLLSDAVHFLPAVHTGEQILRQANTGSCVSITHLHVFVDQDHFEFPIDAVRFLPAVQTGEHCPCLYSFPPQQKAIFLKNKTERHRHFILTNYERTHKATRWSVWNRFYWQSKPSPPMMRTLSHKSAI